MINKFYYLNAMNIVEELNLNSKPCSSRLCQTFYESDERRRYILNLINATQDKHLVFFYGTTCSGKTTVLGSMLYAMRNEISIFPTDDNFFQSGAVLWNNIRHSFDAQRFPPRTASGTTYPLLVKYRPDSNDELDIIFLDISGDELRDVKFTSENCRILPFHNEAFLDVKKETIIFIITVSWGEARMDDEIINSFLRNLYAKYNRLVKIKLLILITKWDLNKNSNEDVFDFVRKHMPLTFSKLGKGDVIQTFSIGHIIFINDDRSPNQDDIIRCFNFAASQGIFKIICSTFTAESYHEKKKLQRGTTMDIVTSAIAGALGNLSSSAVQNAYNWLKDLVQRKFGVKSEMAEAVKKLEQEPDSEGRRGTLSEEVQAVGADKDAEILKAAEALRAVVEEQAIKGGTVVNQYVIGGSGHTFTQSGPVIVKH